MRRPFPIWKYPRHHGFIHLHGKDFLDGSRFALVKQASSAKKSSKEERFAVFFFLHE